MSKRGSLLGVVTLLSFLLALLLNSVSVSATYRGAWCGNVLGDSEPCASSFGSSTLCYHGSVSCERPNLLSVNYFCEYDSSSTGTHSGNYCGSDGDTLLSDSCTGSGIVANTVTVCSVGRDGCVSSLSQYWDYYCSGSSCTYTASCDNSCCGSGQTCQGSPRTCQPTPPPPAPCADSDGDNYYSNAAACGQPNSPDCNDADRNVHANNACGVCAAEPSPAPGGSCSRGFGACLRTGTYQCGAAGTATYCGDSSGNVLEPGSPSSEICTDRVDNDCDGSTDCGDTDCVGNAACAGQPPPACNNNGVCNSGENAQNCAADCTRCGDGSVTGSEQCEPGLTPQPTCSDGSRQTCNPTTCTWNNCPGAPPAQPGGCRSNADCPVASAPQCSGLKTVDRTVGGYCTASRSCQYQYSCVSGSCGAACSLGSYTNVGCSTGFTKNCNSDCSWSACVACTDSDRDGFYYQGGCGTSIDCNDANPALTTSCPAAAGGGYCGDGICQNTESQHNCPSDCRVAIPQTCGDGLRNQDELGVDCGGVCATNAVEVCNGADDDKDCLVDEGEVCNPCVFPVVVADEDTSRECCLYRGHKWGKSGELSIPSYDVKVTNYTGSPESGYYGGEVAGTDNFVYRRAGNILTSYASYMGINQRQYWKKDLASLLSASTRDRFYTADVQGFVMGGGSRVNAQIKVGGTFSPSGIAGTPDNGVIVVGNLWGTSSTTSWEDKSQDGILVAKFDSAGNLAWKAYWRGVGEHWRFGLYNPTIGLFGGQDYTNSNQEYFGQFDLNENYKFSFEAGVVTVNDAGEVLVTGRMRTASWERYCIRDSCNEFRVEYGVSNYLIKIGSGGQIVGSTVAGLFTPSGISSSSYPQVTGVAYAPRTGSLAPGMESLTGSFYAVGTYYSATHTNPPQLRATYVLSTINSGLSVIGNAFVPTSGDYKEGMSVAYDPNLNRVLVVGSGKSSSAATTNYSVWAHDPATGRVVSQFSFDTPADDQGYDVMVDADGGYVVAGTAGIVKFDKHGRKLWSKATGSAARDIRRLGASGPNKLVFGADEVSYPIKVLEANVLVDAGNAYGQFADDARERKATAALGLDAELCIGDDASELFFLRNRQCDAGVCVTDTADAAVCDKSSDCVFQGRCYSDVDRVAATYFGNDRAKVWSSPWKAEVAANVDVDAALELCDPGQWFETTGSVVGFVKDTAGAGLDAATVTIPGTTYTVTSVAGGAYAINSVFPGSYDFVASKAGYFDNASQTGIVVVPVTPTNVNFTLQRAVATVSGTVTNISGDPVADAVVWIVGTVFNTLTDANGQYSLPGVAPGFYDLAAEKDSDGYGDSLVVNQQVVAPSTTSIDFVLLKALEGCEDDCTKVGSNLCDVSCHGKGLCWFYNDATKAACDGTFGLTQMPDGKYVDCCMGKAYVPIKARATVPSKNVVITKKPVVYKGKFVNMVMVVFENPAK